MEPLRAEEVVAAPIKRKRGRPPKPRVYVPEPVAPQWPIVVDVLFSDGHQERIGCVAFTFESGMFVFSTPAGIQVKKRYIAASQILDLQSTETQWHQPVQPQQQWQTPAAAPQQPTGPVVYEARQGLRSRIGPGGIPQSQTPDGAIVSAGFMGD